MRVIMGQLLSAYSSFRGEILLSLFHFFLYTASANHVSVSY